MATEQWIASAARPDKIKAVGAGFLADDHALAGAGITYGTDDAESVAAEMFVRRVFNRHDCRAAKRRAEDGRMDWVRTRYECTDPRHEADVAAMAEALQWLGLRDTPRRKRRADAITARPPADARRGRCPSCRRIKNLRKDGNLTAHRTPGGTPCSGEGERPIEEDA